MKYAFLFFFLLASWPASAEDRIKIAIIDTGVNPSPALLPYMCDGGHHDFTGMGLGDAIGHGTAVAELAMKGLNPERFCVVILKWMHWRGDKRSEGWVVSALQLAVQEHVKFINMSLSGPGENAGEQIAIQDALSQGTVVVVAAGNDNCDMRRKCVVYPACYPIKSRGFRVVGSTTRDAETNYGTPVTDWAKGTAVIRGQTRYGTSFAAPRVVNRLAKEIK